MIGLLRPARLPGFLFKNISRSLCCTPSPAPPEPKRSKLSLFLELSRVDKPVGVGLLFLPCVWGLSLANPGHLPDLVLTAQMAVGAFAMRGFGCTVNDMADVEFDKRVARTAGRPLAAGLLTRADALQWLAIQGSVGLAVVLTIPKLAALVSVSSLGLVLAYPFMKRITYWPQAWLGLTFNVGAIVGYTAISGSVDPVVVPLYLAGVMWTLVYDTIYAHSDKLDDRKIGVKSTALLFGAKTKQYLSGFTVLSTALLATAGVMQGLPWTYYAGITAATAHLATQIAKVDLDDSDDCQKTFRACQIYGALITAAIIA